MQRQMVTITEGETSLTWLPPHLLSFCLSPWWCVMFRGDNRCHGETPLVSALWGTLMTHTQKMCVCTHTHIQPFEHKQFILWTMGTTDDSPVFSPFSTFTSYLLFSFTFSFLSAFSHTHIHLPHFWTTVPLGDQTSSSPLKSLSVSFCVSALLKCSFFQHWVQMSDLT